MIDENALGAAQGKAADLGWMFTTAQHRKDMEAIISAYLDALSQGAVGRGWQPIETVPPGHCVWLSDGERYVRMGFPDDNMDQRFWPDPKYWMELPSRPNFCPIEVDGVVEA